MDRTWELKIEGLNEVQDLFDKLPDKLETNLYLGFQRYVQKNLIRRMKERISKGIQPLEKSTMDPNTGIPSGDGGYGLPENGSEYSEWKKTRSNLPAVGQLGTRELVATGYLVDSLDVTSTERGLGSFSFTVGAKPGQRPSVQPFKNDPKGSLRADLNRIIDNTQLMEWIEDSKYAFLAKEYEDVMRDIEPLVLHILKITLLQLAKEFTGKK